MANPPPGLGGGGGRPGPPPGFGGNVNVTSTIPSPTASSGRSGGGEGGTAVIVRAQIVFLLTTMTEDSFEKASNEIRTLASTNGPEMYHHFLRRATVVANPVLQTLIQHSQQYKDDPAAPPPNIPTSGQAALAWRLLITEAIRVSRDPQLSPHFTLIMLSPSPSTPLPLPSLRLFGLSPAFLFSLTAYSLASPNIFPPNHTSRDLVHLLLRQTFVSAMEMLRSPGLPFWSNLAVSIPNQQNYSDDLSLQEARSLILALYPRSPPTDPSRPPTPINTTTPHLSPLSSPQRATLLASMAVKFSSPAIILQTLSALSPGGPLRSQGTIPLEDMLFELGANLTQDEGTVGVVIERWWRDISVGEGEDVRRAINEEAGRTVLGLCEGLREGRGIDLHGVVKALCAVESISFPDVIRAFDTPNTIAAYQYSLPLFISLLLVPDQNPLTPLAGLLPASPESPIWTNTSSLLSVLERLTHLAPDRLPIFTMPNPPSPAAFARIVDPPAADSTMSKAAKQQAKEIQNAGLWNTLGLIQVLVTACGIAESGAAGEESVDIGRRATEMLEKAILLAPELVLIALEKLPKPFSTTVTNLYNRLLGAYLTAPAANVTSSQLVFHQMWALSQENVLSTLLEFYQEDENNLGRVVDIGLELKILDKLLASDNTHFALDVAALAANKEYLDLEKWLADGVEVKGLEVLEGIFEFAEHKIRLEIDHQHQPDSVPPLLYTLGTDVYSIIIRVVRNAENLSREDIARFKHLRTDILIIHPRLLNLRPGSKDEQGFTAAKFGKDIVAHVDDMYQRMYGGEQEFKLDDVISELERCRKSEDDREKSIFACALHSLFDEYKFVKGYPPKELTMTGILFGAIIDSRLVEGTPAFVATRYLLDAIKTPPHEALYQFGINALSVLRGSLVDFPGLCRSLLEIPALHESHPVLINDIHAALAEREDLDLQGGVKLAFPALKLPILVEEGDDAFHEPESKKKDAIMFIINQIAPSNYEAKAKDLVELFENDLSRWFAHYFIDVRVSLEANRHDIYLQLLEGVNSPVLERHVLWETYRKARDLLNQEATVSSTSERATLKTIALWLGKITLGRNKPIKMRELSVKDLLIQGYDNKRLIVAIPFVCNILLATKESIVFHPPNPWMVAILALIAEFYHYAELRLNLKFEIEVLFKNLGIQIESIVPSNLLRNHTPPPPPQPEVPNRLDAEFQRATAELMNGSQRFEPPVDPAFARLQAFQTEQAAQVAQVAFGQRVDELVAQLPEHLIFSTDYPIFTAPTLKRIVHHSIARAIREIITPVVDRSVTIAGISSRDLVSKDFGTEADPMKLRHAAHIMVQNLAGNLALVTCKEPLRTAMITTIRSMLMQNGFTEDNMPDQMVQGVVDDNIDVTCEVIRTAAKERSAKDIDINLAPQYAARRAHREARTQAPFWDGASFGVTISHAALPDPLRLRTGGLTSAQLRVYEDFGEPSRVVAEVHGDYDRYPDLDIRQSGSPQQMYIEHDGITSPPVIPPQSSLDKFHELVGEVEKFLVNAPVSSLSALPPDHDIHHLIRAAVMIAGQSANREGTTLIISQKVVQLLYKSGSGLGREVYVVMLQSLCETSRKVDKEVKHWLIYTEDSRKFNVPVTVTLIRAGVIPVQELDTQLAAMIVRSFAPEILDFVADLIRECSLSENACVPRNGFAGSLAASLKAREVGRSTPSVDALLDDLRGPRAQEMSAENPSNGNLETKPAVDSKLQERLAHYFLEWVRVFSTSKNPEVAFIPYITYLQKEGILNGEDVSSAFYRTAVYCAVDLDGYKSDDGSRFYGTDALAKLIVLIVKNYGDKSGMTNAARTVYYYNKIITIVAYSLVQRQLEDSFAQRPWARFFTSMLSELGTIEHGVLNETYLGCLKHFANTLGITQPTYAPRFAFGWLSIISHRLFMPKLLGAREEGWPEYHRCVMWLLRFLAPFLKSGEMTPSARSVYRATLRILLVLMQDFPEFLVEYYHSIITAIPPHCVQLRNIVLCAFPQSEAPLPDHYKRLDQLQPDMQRFPTVRSDFSGVLASGNMKAAMDQYVRTGVPPQQAIVAELKNRIAVKSMGAEGETVVTYNHTLLHAVVFYLGTTAVARRFSQTGVVEFDAKMPEVGLLTGLAFALDGEGQYYMLSVIADQLRYPSAHTLFFIHLLLYLFSTASRSEVPNSIAERVARALLERVLATRPHPWGLVIMFIELLDNENYGFWKQPFVRSEEEIYRLFVNAHANIAHNGAGLGPGQNGGGQAGIGPVVGGVMNGTGTIGQGQGTGNGGGGGGGGGMGFVGGPSMISGQ